MSKRSQHSKDELFPPTFLSYGVRKLLGNDKRRQGPDVVKSVPAEELGFLCCMHDFLLEQTSLRRLKCQLTFAVLLDP